MKIFCLTTMVVAFLLLSSYGLHAQATQAQIKPVFLDNTEQISLASKYVAGENYIIQVGLPIGYAPSKKSYPVLYVLDGDKSFGMTKEIADWLMWSKEIKDIIVVGISYGQGMDAWWQKRARDFSHCDDTILFKGWFKQTGGAENFLKFIKNELFPVINKNYKTNQDSTAITGISLGGMLNTYVLFMQPDLFKGYIIIAPCLVWNNKSILKMEEEYSQTEIMKRWFANLPKEFPNSVLNLEVVENTENLCIFKISKCLWAKTFREAEAADIGYAILCYGDYASAKSNNEKLERETTLMQGHEYCLLKWTKIE